MPKSETVLPPVVPSIAGTDSVPATPEDDSSQWSPVQYPNPAPAVAGEQPPPENEPGALPQETFGPATPTPSGRNLLSAEPEPPVAGPERANPPTFDGYSVLDMLSPEGEAANDPLAQPEIKPATGGIESRPVVSPGSNQASPEEPAEGDLENARFVVVKSEEGTFFESPRSGTRHLEKGTVLKRLSGNDVSTQVRLRDYSEGTVATSDLRQASMKESLGFFRFSY